MDCLLQFDSFNFCRNGREKVELDLIVLDTLPDCECQMFKTADKMCTCTNSYTG